MPVLSFALVAALLGCADKQYVAVPGAYVFVGDDPQTQATAQAPVVTVVQGVPQLVVGESVTMHVDVTMVTEVALTEVRILTVPAVDEWVYPFSEDEIAAGGADIEIQLRDDKPTERSCEVNTKYGQNGWCAAPVEHETTQALLWGANETQSSSTTWFPLEIGSPDPADTPDSCASFTFADCCPSAGVVLCALDPACGCPSGTSDGGLGGDGYRQCTCPR